MEIATWNVNSIRTRLPRLLDWLDRCKPDLVCLQELKAEDSAFPFEAIHQAGYHAAVYGQKTYNGVAILCRQEPDDVRRGPDFGGRSGQSRLLSALVAGVRIFSVYVPNGREVGSEHYDYKLRWLSELLAFLQESHRPDEPLLLCGDWNIAPSDSDVANPERWRGSVLCHDKARESLAALQKWGLIDVFRRVCPEPGFYTWWDYRRLAFPKNDGLRIDHILATETLAGRCVGATIQRDLRKGSKPSDHAPVVARFRT